MQRDPHRHRCDDVLRQPLRFRCATWAAVEVLRVEIKLLLRTQFSRGGRHQSASIDCLDSIAECVNLGVVDVTAVLNVSYPKDMYVRRYAELVSELAYEY